MFNERVAKLCEGTKGLRQKVWTRTKISNPNIRYVIKINYENLSRFLYFSGGLWAKKCSFGSKTVPLGQEVHYNMVHIAYYTELNLQICNYAQNDAFVAKLTFGQEQTIFS